MPKSNKHIENWGIKMDCLTYCKMKYYSQDNSASVLAQIQKKLNKSITTIIPEMLCIFNDTIRREPSSYWNKVVYQQTFEQLNSLYNDHSTSIQLNDEIIEHFLIGYYTYHQITEIINDLSKLNDNPEIKNRLYRIPTYVSIVEGCLTNLFRSITLILNQTSSKDFASAKKLNPICDILKSNGFDTLVTDVDIDIRNAINHGGVIFKEGGKKINFQYNKNRQPTVTYMLTYQFDNLIDRVYDAASGVLLGIATFINAHKSLIVIDKNEKQYVSFCWMALELSIPGIRIKNVSESPNNEQLNIDIIIDNTDRGYIQQMAIMLSILVYDRYNDFKKYMFFFSNERLQGSWVRFTNEEIQDMNNLTRTFVQVMKVVIERQDCIIFNPSTEPVDLQEIKYHRFPNYSELEYKINRIEDASTEERKRLKAHLFIGDISDKGKILEIIQKSIDWLKTVRNVASPTFPHKYGSMDADSLYINVYRNDDRKNKELFPSNENFVCFVDYNIDGETTLVDGGLPATIWTQLHHEKVRNMQIAWREGKYVMRRIKKIGRNDPCLCGSGKKYKKCCGKNV